MSTTAPSPIQTTVVQSLITFGAKPDDVQRDATWEDIDVDSLDSPSSPRSWRTSTA